MSVIILKLTKNILSIAAALGMLVVPALAKAQDPASASSCMGQEAAAVSPVGSSDEFPGGMPELHAFVRSLGVEAGAVYSKFAKLHAGSHEACDAAFE